MKKLLFILFVFVSSFGFSQNLVPNPSFEDYNYCPTYASDFSVSEWFRLDTINMICPTPDYFNSCALPSSLVSIPSNYFGYQNPYSGKAYIGMYTFVEMLNYREIVWSKLIDSLQIGNKYYIKYYVSASDYNGYTNNIGILFSTAYRDLSGPYPLIDNISHANINYIISDTINWIEYSTSFIADSSYKYIYVGNFYDDSHTDTLSIVNNGSNAYYFIDNICVSTDSLECNLGTRINNENIKEQVKIYPNPTTGVISITNDGLQITDLQVFDIYGKEVYVNRSLSQSKCEIDLSQQPKGIYIIKVRTDKGVAVEKVIKN